MIIVLFFDNKYFHFVKPLVNSIIINEPKAKIYAHTFNLNDKQIKRLKIYPNISIVINEKIKFDPKVSDEYHIDLNKDKPLRFQLTCRRGEYLLNAMKAFPEEDLFIISDVDTLMINPLTELKNQMKKYDIGVVRVDETKICSGFFVARNTKNSKKYLKEFYNTAMNGRLFLCKDQKSMAKVYENNKNNIKFLMIDRRYLDFSCDKNSFMWSGHKSHYGSKQEKFNLYDYTSKNLKNKKDWNDNLEKWKYKMKDKIESKKSTK